jgi:acyl-CoA oxidase
MQKQLRVIEMVQQLGLDRTEQQLLRNAVHDDLGTDLQTLMFVPNIAATFSAEQQETWLPGAVGWKILGCYAQTVLGHGSNVSLTDCCDRRECIIHYPFRIQPVPPALPVSLMP